MNLIDIIISINVTNIREKHPKSDGIQVKGEEVMSEAVRKSKYYPRACFKIAFWQLCVTVCGRFDPDEGRVAGYVT